MPEGGANKSFLEYYSKELELWKAIKKQNHEIASNFY